MHSQTCTQYLRLLLCDKNEGIVVNKITVNVLSEGRIKRLCSQNNLKINEKYESCDFSYRVIAANATFSIQSCALRTSRISRSASQLTTGLMLL